ncbi:MAG: CDGSH iron-sulfur domain-containing protein [Nocardioidaceae bacterium]|nr:CDGSH iron-sulfur domain-containing protein [Nocardioidaceae bacterium]MCL2614429.1 CDGSH iron-sulfur domain-containing protein [Nocardioidaceae bacterium]
MSARRTQAVVVPGGPLLLRGADVVLDEDGEQHEVGRPVVALCACGLSQRKPWCDGTHKLAQGPES